MFLTKSAVVHEITIQDDEQSVDRIKSAMVEANFQIEGKYPHEFNPCFYEMPHDIMEWHRYFVVKVWFPEYNEDSRSRACELICILARLLNNGELKDFQIADIYRYCF